MSRPRKNFFLEWTAFDEWNGQEPPIGSTIHSDGIAYIILKIHPRKGGVTARKA